jgi:hypothetical protein
MQLPMQYRPTGRGDWLEATTINISSSGMLFAGDVVLERCAHVEMRLVLPGRIAPATDGSVECHGLIVRVQPAAPGRGRVVMAATIANYRMIRTSRTTT